MKARIDCTKCRKAIIAGVREEFLKDQYEVFSTISDTFGKCCTAVMLMAMVRRGRSKKYIQDLFEELVMIYDMPNVFDKDVRSDDVIKRLEAEYGLDFGRIHIHLESESQFLKECKE